jgi:hypothetical protein
MTRPRGAPGPPEPDLRRDVPMSDYQRYTYLPVREVLQKADEILPARAGLKKTRDSSHGATYTGAEGTLNLEAHRHGPSTDVVISTNQLRTSKIDTVARFLLNQLPYQPGDRPQGL